MTKTEVEDIIRMMNYSLFQKLVSFLVIMFIWKLLGFRKRMFIHEKMSEKYMNLHIFCKFLNYLDNFQDMIWINLKQKQKILIFLNWILIYGNKLNLLFGQDYLNMETLLQNFLKIFFIKSQFCNGWCFVLLRLNMPPKWLSGVKWNKMFPTSDKHGFSFKYCQN